MGDIADMMIDGTLDQYTGEYIGKPCGYPRSINHHIKKQPYSAEVGIAMNYLKQKNFPTDKSNFIRDYGRNVLKMNLLKNDLICNEIRKSDTTWKEFKKFVNLICT
jgi:hypothetical protein